MQPTPAQQKEKKRRKSENKVEKEKSQHCQGCSDAKPKITQMVSLTSTTASNARQLVCLSTAAHQSGQAVKQLTRYCNASLGHASKVLYMTGPGHSIADHGAVGPDTYSTAHTIWHRTDVANCMYVLASTGLSLQSAALDGPLPCLVVALVACPALHLAQRWYHVRLQYPAPPA